MENNLSAWELLPKVILDDDGYPTTEWIEYIKKYKPDDSLTVSTFVEHVLIDGWHFSDWGFSLGRKYKGRKKT